MRTRIVAMLTAGVLAGGFVGVAQAEPGPNGNNDHGICTAYFNGQKSGHDQGNSPGPFGALEDMHDDDIQAIFDFCSGVDGPGNGSGGDGIGGNPDENGRFTDCFDDSDGNPNTDSCTDGGEG